MIVKTEKVTKRFGGNIAVNQVSITIPTNKITSIIGPNGSGKSTLFNVITRLLPQDAGKVYVKNQDTTSFNDYAITQDKISRTFQEIRVFDYLTIRQHMQLALSDNHQGVLKNLFAPQVLSDEEITKHLALVGLKQSLEKKGEDLSYGQSKLLNLAMNIAKKHEILLLDEPVAGINPGLRSDIEKILKNLKKQGETILLIEHDMNFVINISDLIIVMDAGEIILEGDKKAILANKKVLKAYLGR